MCIIYKRKTGFLNFEEISHARNADFYQANKLKYRCAFYDLSFYFIVFVYMASNKKSSFKTKIGNQSQSYLLIEKPKILTN